MSLSDEVKKRLDAKLKQMSETQMKAFLQMVKKQRKKRAKKSRK